MQVAGRYIYPRRAAGADWAKHNVILGLNEPGIEIDSTPRRLKIGDGATPWLDLPYATALDALVLLVTATPKITSGPEVI